VLRPYPDRGGLVAGVVESVLERSAVVRSRDGVAVELGWDDFVWARAALPDDQRGPPLKSAADVFARGQIVYLEPLADGGRRLAQLPAVAGALVALQPRDGAIVALAGGFDFATSKYNRAVQARRQPGSAFKPFVYSAALERGFTPASLINDAPIVLPGGVGTEEWRPQNITKRFYGPTPLREALVRSRNLVSIRLLRATGIGPAVRHIAAFGFGAEALPANLTLALGTGQVTPLEMARGYAVFANGGFLVTPYLIERVADSQGKTVFAAAPPVACADCQEEPRAPQAISPANAFVMTDVMTDVIQRGTATAARSLGRSDLAGKTGTTNDRRDAWFLGFNADIAAAAWIGFDQERSLGDNEEGGRTALPMWIYFMEEALRDRPEHRLPEPPGVVRMWVDRSTGRPTSAGAGGAVFEAFLEGHVPQADALAEGDEVGNESVDPDAADDSLF
jgi:penicillin-binding protein 1A